MEQIPNSIQSIFLQSPALALALFIWYYSNRDILRILQERREMIEALRLERKEWLATLQQVMADYRVDSRSLLTASEGVKAEMHALRGKMTELILKVEIVLMRAEKDEDNKKSGGHD